MQCEYKVCNVSVCLLLQKTDLLMISPFRMIHRCLESYELVYRQTYLHSNAMATLLEMGAER